jgi:Pyruvate/2-oxoacid:ferredoxin oxidoreductase delta subunit
MNRLELATKLLGEHRFFKLVCGAGNENPDEVRKLSLVYTLAGASAIDVSSNPEIVKSAIAGINIARTIKNIDNPPFIMVSVGMAGDHHIRKAVIDIDECDRCGLCAIACSPRGAIVRDRSTEFSVLDIQCIGCGKCSDVCPRRAIGFYYVKGSVDMIPACVSAGAEMVEFHAVNPFDSEVLSVWGDICTLPVLYRSMCLDRSILSDNHFKDRIKQAYAIAGDNMMLQADGAPMSGGADDFHTTLQAVAASDIALKSGVPIKVIASGGTNSLTRELANSCGVHIHGVAVGTYARNIIDEYIRKDGFEHSLYHISRAETVAKILVERCTR